MKHNSLFRRGAALLLCLALALTTLAACSSSDTGSSSSQESQSSSSTVQEESSQLTSSASEDETSSTVSQLKPEPRTAEDSSAAEGAEDAQVKEITLKVVHGDGSEKEFPISTEAATLGEALEAEGLISGEESSYGLFVTTVDGETVDDANQEWWCLTKGGEMCTTGVDTTEIATGDTYELTFTVGY
ncbi:MAG: DUF4430 domain-containing protein [Acutalibacter sp.]|jgi:hypothetical protein